MPTCVGAHVYARPRCCVCTCFREPVPWLFWEDLHVMGAQPHVRFQVCHELMGAHGSQGWRRRAAQTALSPPRPAGPGAGTQGQECAQGLPLGSLGPGHAVHGRQNGEGGLPRAQPHRAHTRLSRQGMAPAGRGAGRASSLAPPHPAGPIHLPAATAATPPPAIEQRDEKV